MKKLFVLLIMLFCMIFLCACNEEPSENGLDTEESKSSFESSSLSSVQELPSPSQKEESSSVPETGSAFKDDPSVSYLGKAEGAEIYKKAAKTDEMRLDIVYGKDGIFNSTKEVPATEYWIINSGGNLLIEHPFYDLYFWEGNDIFGIELYKSSGIEGCYKGNHYVYSFIDGEFELVDLTEAGEYAPNESYTGRRDPNYVRTRYSYTKSDIHYGLSDKDGNVIFDPVFTYYVEIPFYNRFIVTTNNVDRMDSWESFSALVDADKNVLCTYTDIRFFEFDDGSYIGIALYVGGENGGHTLYDENGDVLKLGYRFIDKDGNELSPCFDSDYFLDGFQEYIEKYLDEVITATSENGSAVELTGRDYIIR